VKVIELLSRILGYISTCLIFVMMLLLVGEVCGRYFINKPITGSTEFACALMVTIGFPALAWCTMKENHIKVELVVGRFSRRVQAIIDSFTLFCGLSIYIIVTWRTILEASHVSSTASIYEFPEQPFYWIMVVGYTVFCLAMATVLIKKVREAVKR
jgi:TRAP-type transport system small permease protein